MSWVEDRQLMHRISSPQTEHGLLGKYQMEEDNARWAQIVWDLVKEAEGLLEEKA